MWILTVRSPGGEPRQYTLHPGNNTIGRMSGNDIVILDGSASRYHAQVIFDPERDQVTVQDLGSTNGTYVNRKRLIVSRPMFRDDIIRIGQHLIELSNLDQQAMSKVNGPVTTQVLTHELIVESVDHHAVLLSNVSARLNTILDLPTALATVSNMVKVAIGADRCEVILIDELDKLAEMGFARSVAQQAIQQRSAIMLQDAASDPDVGSSAALFSIHAAMCVPVMDEDEILALIYVVKNRQRARAFDQRDLQLTVAISNQIVLTIQRMKLLERVRHQEMVSNLLNRFLAPEEAQSVMNDYLDSGQLPPIQEYTLTIVAVDICQSTALAQRLGARRFGEIVTTYYQEMTEAVFAHGGMLNKYLGDGLLAVFGLPNQPNNPEERAVSCALNILERLSEMNKRCGENIDVGVGVNTGPVMAGYLGNLKFVEFITVGFPVNLAWGLEALARPNRVLIGHSTYQAVCDEFTIQSLGPVDIRSQPEAVLAYEVLPGASQ